MSDDASARLGLPYLAAGQMQKHVTMNEALTRLDALVQLAVVSRTTATQPSDPDDGDLYILPEDATGSAWTGWGAGVLARAEIGGWLAIERPDGLIAVVLDAGEVVLRHAGDWVRLGERLGAVQGLTRLGINTTADAANPFSAKLNTALWTALETGSGGDGDLRLTLNKEAPADVLSLLFQSGYGGRAELGLIGDDDLRLKVSADGATWRDALVIDASTGRATLPQGAARAETTILTADAAYAVPAWAAMIEVVCVGAGGGGGAGAVGAAGTARFGGGGGGAGGVTTARWLTQDLPSSLTILVGTAGAGGVAANGADGADSTIAGGGSTLLTGCGGEGGRVGDGVSGLGGAGGLGAPGANGGGASSITVAGQAGQALQRPDGGGGGGAGGGLDSANVARDGGAGGSGALLACTASGGSGGSGAAGAAGSAPLAPSLHWAGGGGGGGGASAAGSGHAGGSAGDRGAGGGGGGAGLSAGGVGGAGASGVVWLTAIG